MGVTAASGPTPPPLAPSSKRDETHRRHKKQSNQANLSIERSNEPPDGGEEEEEERNSRLPKSPIGEERLVPRAPISPSATSSSSSSPSSSLPPCSSVSSPSFTAPPLPIAIHPPSTRRHVPDPSIISSHCDERSPSAAAESPTTTTTITTTTTTITTTPPTNSSFCDLRTRTSPSSPTTSSSSFSSSSTSSPPSSTTSSSRDVLGVTSRKLLFFGAVFLLSLVLPRVLSDAGVARSCGEGATCGQCIQIGPHCNWCADESYNASRCSDAHLTCKGVQKVKSTANPTLNKPLRDEEGDQQAIQMRPQRVDVELQVGKTQTVEVTFKPAKDYPVDLYYLMDLSRSMLNDKLLLAKLGKEIGEQLSTLTSSVKMGFGTFVDKPVMPYVSIAANGSLRSPCDYRLEQNTLGHSCDLPYTFKNKLSLTDELDQFERAVDQTRISGNLDGPEGGLEAMMQVIACKKEIGWRESSRKLIVYSSDAAFHTAGDGLLGGIVEPNDGKCHLEKNEYTMATEMDYPSIGQIADAIAKKKITVIFAVMEDVEDIYTMLKDELEGARVGRITNDSSNIVNLVVDNYREIKQYVKLQLRHSHPGYHVKFAAKCGKNAAFEGDACEKVELGEKVKFQINITLDQRVCQGKRAGEPRKLIIEPQGIPEKMTINVKPICECECEKPENEEKNSPKCSNGNGTFECGQCTCNEKRYGQICQCSGKDVKSEDHKELCKRPNAKGFVEPGVSVCSGHGECVCGKCECTEKAFTGKYCQCNAASCPRFQQKLCAGPTHGTCSCDAEGDIATCKCLEGWSGKDCSCPSSEEPCMNGGQLCSGQGKCSCHKKGKEIIRKCHCNQGFYGATCENSAGVGCEQYKLCVKCRVHYDSRTMLSECDPILNNGTTICDSVVVTKVDGISEESSGKSCKFDLDNKCRYQFVYEQKPNGTTFIYAATEPVCSESFNLPLTISAIAGAIVAIGLAALLIWRLVAYISDIREFARFEEEKKKRKWAPVQNALYQPPVTTIINPAYKRKGGPNMYN